MSICLYEYKQSVVSLSAYYLEQLNPFIYLHVSNATEAETSLFSIYLTVTLADVFFSLFTGKRVAEFDETLLKASWI